ncbi:hypothetical protein HDU76_007305 [Blyttiomyces sp. JEL0837]|nr:hypothetical protein HDU76_007305 [Blyttiomyces sp. JEL0837]
MDDPNFYINYLDNRPVELNTHILNTSTFVWVQNIFEVEDLFAGFKSAVSPRFDSTPVDELTLHLPDGRFVMGYDGININAEHLERPELVTKLANLVGEFRFVRLTSPSASGKSSLLMVYEHSLKKLTKRTDVVWISCLDSRTPSDLLLQEAGIDLVKRTTVDGVGEHNLIVFLDDAQAKYADLEFWNLLNKSSPIWLPATISFVISSTHLLVGGVESPVVLESLQRLERKDFLLSTEEAEQFLNFNGISLPTSMRLPTLKTLLINECGGLIGALRSGPSSALSVRRLRCRYESLLWKSSLCPIGDDFKKFLKRIVVNENVRPPSLANKTDEESYLSRQKAGILVENKQDRTFMFSSPLAKRYYFRWIFPDRSFSKPASLHELVRNVVGSMSSNLLKHSTVPGEFPKEAVFQHMFTEGLARFTKANCSICPELSKVFPDPNSNVSGAIAGEIDF